MGLIDKLQSRLELYRLEQKYAKRKNRQTFTTGATYADGEYHYDSAYSQPISASSTGSSSRKRASMLFGGRR